MKIFDIHTHVFPEKIARRAVEHLRDKSNGLPAWLDGAPSSLASRAAEVGYTGWMNCPVVTNASQMCSVNDQVALVNKWPHISMGGLYPNAPLEQVIAEVKRIKELGLYGIKLHPEYQEFYILDERLSPMWQAISDAELPVLFHAGSDVGFYGTPQHSWPADFAELAARFPKLVIICAHLGGWRNWELVERDLCGANVYLDTAFAKPWMADRQMFERIIRKHGVDKILYGTDSPWNDLQAGIQEIMETGLTDEEKQAIFWDNAARIFHF